MRRIFLLTVFCFACLMVGAQSVRLMSYNIHNGVGMDKVRDYDRLANRSLEEAKQRLLERIALAEREKAEGGYTDGPVAMAELRERYGL